LDFFIKTDSYVANIRKMGFPKKATVKSIVNNFMQGLKKQSELKSKMPAILQFDLFKEYDLFFMYYDDGFYRISILTKEETKIVFGTSTPDI